MIGLLSGGHLAPRSAGGRGLIGGIAGGIMGALDPGSRDQQAGMGDGRGMKQGYDGYDPRCDDGYGGHEGYGAGYERGYGRRGRRGYRRGRRECGGIVKKLLKQVSILRCVALDRC